MSIDLRSRLPVSARHAFALAFDIAFRRDPVQSLAIPVLMRAPWILIPAMLDPLGSPNTPRSVYAIASMALIVDFFLLLLTCGMMRFRARSVFNTPPTSHPAPVLECYARSLTRLPWLFVTEMVRSLVLLFGTFFLVAPGVYFGFRLSCATEAVVLDEPHLSAAFQRSFRVTQSRFERWFEMVTLSGFIALTVIFVMTVLAVIFKGLGVTFWFAATQVMMVLVTAVIQYAWTFFYLRLTEVEQPGIEVGPMYAGPVDETAESPRLRLVEPESGNREGSSPA
jgi:hypothetical protein